MNDFKEGIFLIVIIVLSRFLFGILLNGLNKSLLSLFVPLQGIVRTIKNKKKIKLLLIFASIVLCVGIAGLFNLNYITLGILVGFTSSLIDVIFDTEITSK